jgi:hypothetical protein
MTQELLQPMLAHLDTSELGNLLQRKIELLEQFLGCFDEIGPLDENVDPEKVGDILHKRDDLIFSITTLQEKIRSLYPVFQESSDPKIVQLLEQSNGIAQRIKEREAILQYLLTVKYDACKQILGSMKNNKRVSSLYRNSIR